MPEPTPILLCYDRSANARRAIECAGAFFPGERALALHVWAPMIVWASAHGAPVPVAAYSEAEYLRLAGAVAAEGARIAGAAGLDAEPALWEGTYEGTWHAILAAADAHGARLIVMGARGLSTFRSLLLGSIAYGVAQHARRPVLIVPPEDRE